MDYPWQSIDKFAVPVLIANQAISDVLGWKRLPAQKESFPWPLNLGNRL
jgi:hypothetical protein